MKSRIVCFDVARAILMLWIVGAWHLSNYTKFVPSFLEKEISYIWTIGVLATFTFISGWFAALSNEGRNLNFKNYFLFIWKKFIRLYPLYFGAIIMFYMLGMLTKEQLWPSVFLCFEFINEAPITIWYIGVIFIYYILTPIICAIDKPFYKVGICVLLNFLGGGYGIKTCGWDERLIFYFFFFWFGICARSNKKCRHLIEQKNNYVILVVSIIAMLGILYGVNGKVIKLGIVTAVFGFFELLFILEFSKIISHVTFMCNILTVVSYGSVCAYLYHRVIYTLLETVFGKFSWTIAEGVVLPLTIIVSVFIQWIYDSLIKKLQTFSA